MDALDFLEFLDAGDNLKESIVWHRKNPYTPELLKMSPEDGGDLKGILKIQGRMNRKTMKIKKVIFNEPATIVIWADGSKTVVKTQDGETYDPEKGLAMAISKRALGDKGNYYNVFKKWLPKTSTSTVNFTIDIDTNGFAKDLKSMKNAINKMLGKPKNRLL